MIVVEKMSVVLSRVLYNRNLFIIILTPVFLSPLLFLSEDENHVINLDKITNKKFRCVFVVGLMAVYWMTETIPLAITSLLPVALLPILGIQDTSAVTKAYMKETNMMFVGGLIIALSMEFSFFHRRIALRVMSIIGGSPTRLLAGIMITTMFLSMWMSNTSSTAMMLPIVNVILDKLAETEIKTNKKASNVNGAYAGSLELEIVKSEEKAIDLKDTEFELRRANQKKMYLLGVAYSSNLGGTGVLTGTGTNLVLQELLKRSDVSQGGKYLELNFSTWMALNIPIMLVNVFMAYVYLTMIYFGPPNWLRIGSYRKSPEDLKTESDSATAISEMLKQQYKDLGRMTSHEIGVAFTFFLIIGLWFSREPGFMKGWADYLSAEAGDSTAAIFVVFLLFVIPKDYNVLFGELPLVNPGPLLEWNYVQRNLPWGAVLLLGGGFAISDASKVSGLSDWIGNGLQVLQRFEPWQILLIILITTALITEVTSNVATANVLLPILLTLSKSLNLHPLYLTLGTAVTCSYAFMLPVATPSNAIVYSTGDIPVIDMMKTGAFLNIACVLVFFFINITYGDALFKYSDYYSYSNTTLKVAR